MHKTNILIIFYFIQYIKNEYLFLGGNFFLAKKYVNEDNLKRI